MNLFDIVFLDSVLIIFPYLLFLLYISINKKNQNKKLYINLVFITSFFLLLKFGINNNLILNLIIILSYIENLYVLATVLSIFMILINGSKFIIIYIIFFILSLIRKKFNINNIVFEEVCIIISSIIYICFMNKLFSIKDISILVLSYIFITNIVSYIYKSSKKIISTHISYKELQQEKQIRLSLFKITHEIKNPIAVCKGYLDMINANNKDQVKRYIPIIKSEIERLLVLLQDFLLINKCNMDLDIMDINMLIEDTLDKMSSLLKEKNITVKLNLIDDEVYINGDYNRLSQVMINIIKNSIEAITDKGFINIKEYISNNNYYLTIEDNGEGMTKEVLNKMKEPFFTTKSRGSGLGISLIYEIVEAHGGSVDYISNYGVGTKVILSFPLYT